MSLRRARKEEGRGESFDWTLWLKWILVSALGWGFGLALGMDLLIGAVVGLLQWLVLRSLIQGDGWWIPASALGWAGAAGLIAALFQPGQAVESVIGLAALLIGIGIGVGQWLVLRRQVYRAWWWIVLSALGWAVGLMGVLGASLTGAVAGGVTGFALELLLRHPRSQ